MRGARGPCRGLLLLAVLAACGGGDVAAPAPPRAPVSEVPRSVILMIGDGMGPQEVGLLLDWADAAGRAPAHFERLAAEGTVGVLRTGSADSPLTDSAASGTALACGVSTDNGHIATGAAGEALATCLEDARARGRATGLVTTTRVTHATPACFAAHVTTRSQEEEIAAQYVGGGAGADVILGGGAKLFPAPLRAEAAAKGWTVVRTRDELLELPPATTKALGLFAESHVPYAIDRDAPGEATAPTLAEMTRKALDVLARDPDGFFLMVEGGRIDHAGHGNDVAALLGEMREFDEALGVCDAFRRGHPDTLLVVTADHETGGLCVTEGSRRLAAKDFLDMAQAAASIEATTPPPARREAVEADAFGVGRREFYGSPGYRWGDAKALERSASWNVSFGSSGHTTTPVLIAAAGPGAAAFAGMHRNTLVGQRLREWMAR